MASCAARFMSDFYESVDGLDNDGSVAREWKGQSVSTGGTTANQVRLAGLVVGKLTQKKRLTDPKPLPDAMRMATSR